MSTTARVLAVAWPVAALVVLGMGGRLPAPTKSVRRPGLLSSAWGPAPIAL